MAGFGLGEANRVELLVERAYVLMANPS